MVASNFKFLFFLLFKNYKFTIVHHYFIKSLLTLFQISFWLTKFKPLSLINYIYLKSFNLFLYSRIRFNFLLNRFNFLLNRFNFLLNRFNFLLNRFNFLFSFFIRKKIAINNEKCYSSSLFSKYTESVNLIKVLFNTKKFESDLFIDKQRLFCHYIFKYLGLINNLYIFQFTVKINKLFVTLKSQWHYLISSNVLSYSNNKFFFLKWTFNSGLFLNQFFSQKIYKTAKIIFSTKRNNTFLNGVGGDNSLIFYGSSGILIPNRKFNKITPYVNSYVFSSSNKRKNGRLNRSQIAAKTLTGVFIRRFYSNFFEHKVTNNFFKDRTFTLNRIINYSGTLKNEWRFIQWTYQSTVKNMFYLFFKGFFHFKGKKIRFIKKKLIRYIFPLNNYASKIDFIQNSTNYNNKELLRLESHKKYLYDYIVIFIKSFIVQVSKSFLHNKSNDKSLDYSRIGPSVRIIKKILGNHATVLKILSSQNSSFSTGPTRKFRQRRKKRKYIKIF